MDKKILLYIALGLVILVLLVFTFFPNVIYVFRDSGIVGNSVSVQYKCTLPQGVSKEDWQTHMSHHPDIYKECLG